VCDQNCRQSLTFFEIVENRALCFGIDRRDGIVENQNRCVFHQRTRNRDSLLLSAGNRHTALAKNGAVALFELCDIVMDIGHHRRILNGLLVFVIKGEGNIAGNRVGEQEVVLRHVGTALTHGVDGNGVDIVVINEQRSVRHVVGAEQQIDDGRFSGTGLSDDADTLARLNGKRYVFQHIVLPVRIAEGQIAELDFSMDGRQILHTAAVLHIDFCVKQFRNTV